MFPAGENGITTVLLIGSFIQNKFIRVFTGFLLPAELGHPSAIQRSNLINNHSKKILEITHASYDNRVINRGIRVFDISIRHELIGMSLIDLAEESPP